MTSVRRGLRCGSPVPHAAAPPLRPAGAQKSAHLREESARLAEVTMCPAPESSGEARVAGPTGEGLQTVRVEVSRPVCCARNFAGPPPWTISAGADALPERHRVGEVRSAPLVASMASELPPSLPSFAQGAAGRQRELAPDAPLQRGIALCACGGTRRRGRRSALAAHCLIDAAVDRPRDLLVHGRKRWPEPDDHQPVAREAAGVGRDDLAAHRVAEDHRFRGAVRTRLCRSSNEVAMVWRGFAVAVAAVVGGERGSGRFRTARQVVERVSGRAQSAR